MELNPHSGSPDNQMPSKDDPHHSNYGDNDIHYNYQIIEGLKFNLSAMNILNDIHRELVGGAKMGRQVVMRISSEF